jgi:hypothetical protein
MNVRACALAAMFALLGGAVLAAPAPVPGDVQFTMPAGFQGEWNENLEHGTGLNDSRLRITATTIRFYESGGPVKAVVRRGSFEIMLITELSGEGQSWLAAHRLILSSDGSYLTAPSEEGRDLVRYRCPRK